MKLDIEAMAREADTLAKKMRDEAPYNGACGKDWFAIKNEALARLIVERCAQVCDKADKSAHPSDLADAIRNLLED